MGGLPNVFLVKKHWLTSLRRYGQRYVSLGVGGRLESENFA